MMNSLRLARTGVHLICFVDIKEFCGDGFDIGGKHISKKGVYAICHACTNSKAQQILSELHMVRKVLKDTTSLQKLISGERQKVNATYTLYLLPVDDLKGPCVCFPDIWPERDPVKKGGDLIWDSMNIVCDAVENLIVASPSLWRDVFIVKMTIANIDYQQQEEAERPAQRSGKKNPHKGTVKRKAARTKTNSRVDASLDNSDSDSQDDDVPIRKLKNKRVI